jgi:hypothetical protein
MVVIFIALSYACFYNLHYTVMNTVVVDNPPSLQEVRNSVFLETFISYHRYFIRLKVWYSQYHNSEDAFEIVKNRIQLSEASTYTFQRFILENQTDEVELVETDVLGGELELSDRMEVAKPKNVADLVADIQLKLGAALTSAVQFMYQDFLDAVAAATILAETDAEKAFALRKAKKLMRTIFSINGGLNGKCTSWFSYTYTQSALDEETVDQDYLPPLSIGASNVLCHLTQSFPLPIYDALIAACLSTTTEGSSNDANSALAEGTKGKKKTTTRVKCAVALDVLERYGDLLRLSTRKGVFHDILLESEKRRKCSLCHYQVRYKCAHCAAYLCLDPRGGLSSCWRSWHVEDFLEKKEVPVTRKRKEKPQIVDVAASDHDEEGREDVPNQSDLNELINALQDAD